MFLSGLQDAIEEAVGIDELEIYTYHKRGTQIFRGHPNFRGKGHWRDWVWVQFEEDTCCQIWCFVVIPDMEGQRVEYGGIDLEEGVFAVVEWTEKVDVVNDPSEVRISELVVPIEKQVVKNSDGSLVEKILCLADTSAFVAPACVVPDIGGPPNRYFYVEARNKWAEFFTEWLNNPKEEDSLSTLSEDLPSDSESSDSD